jgi:membrane associated rhomboid family serine protease
VAARPRRDWEDPPPPPGGGMVSIGFPSPPLVTKRLLWANVIVFVPCFLLYLFADGVYLRFQQLAGLAPGLWREWAPWLPLWQLASYGFLHSMTEPSHILMNMLGLYFFGSMLEQMVGARRYVQTYLGAVIAGAVLYVVYGLWKGVDIPAVGASGGVLGILVACATLEPNRPVLLFPLPTPIPLKWIAGLWVVLNLMGAALSFKPGHGDGTAYLVHLGGIAFGYGFVKSGLLRFDFRDWRDARRERQVAQTQVRDEDRLDALLERIHREGIGALSERDREFLKRMSGRGRRF